MDQEYIRRKIVQLSKELAEITDYNEVKKLRHVIANLKKLYKPTEPEKLSDLIKGE